MLQIVTLEGESGYYLQNTWTGIVLSNKNGSFRRFRTIKKASKAASKMERGLKSLVDDILAKR